MQTLSFESSRRSFTLRAPFEAREWGTRCVIVLHGAPDDDDGLVDPAAFAVDFALAPLDLPEPPAE